MLSFSGFVPLKKGKIKGKKKEEKRGNKFFKGKKKKKTNAGWVDEAPNLIILTSDGTKIMH